MAEATDAALHIERSGAGRVGNVDAQRLTGSRLELEWRRVPWQWLPVLAAIVYAVGFFVNFGSIFHSIYDVSDWTGLIYMAQVLPSAPHNAGIVMSDLYMLDALGYLISTHWIPGHLFLWELSPWIAGAVASAVLARAVGALYGRWAGWMVFILLFCTGPALFQNQLEWDGHATAQQTICVFGAVAALMPLRGGMLGRSRWTWWTCLIVLALLTGGGFADDPLFTLGGLVPLLVSGGVTAWLSSGAARRRTLWSIGAVTVVGLVLGVLFRAIAAHENITHTSKPITLVAYNAILDHVGLAVQSVVEQLGGNFGSQSLNLAGGLDLLAAVVVVGGIYAGYRLARRQVLDLMAHRADAASARLDQPSLARVGLIVFWLTSMLLLLFSVLFTSEVVDITGQRYLLTVTYGVVVLAVAALASQRSGRLIGAVGASVVVLSAALSIWQKDLQQELVSFPGPSDAAQLEKWAKSKHLTYGFASYWDAYPLSWWSRSQPAVYPVTGCGTATAGLPDSTLCAYNQLLTSWYAPRPHTRSFLAVDDSFLTYSPGSLLGVVGAPSALGKPVRVAHVGRFTVYVYPYDVASRFGPAQS
jgi:hypothetical protein